MSFEYDYSKDFVKWGDAVINNAVGRGVVSITHDVGNHRALVRLQKDHPWGTGGNVMGAGGFLVAQA